MRVIERSEFRDEEGVISLENRIRGTLEYGLKWYSEMQAQDRITQRLKRSLGDDYVLIRNLSIPGTRIPIPMILIGPQGVRVMRASPLRGLFRAKGDQWLTFDGRARRFKRARPNQQLPVLSMAQIVLKHLEAQGYALPGVEAVLAFTNPRTHVDTARPRTRILLADAVDHFAANLQALPPIMDSEDVHDVAEALLHPKPPEPEPTPEPPPQPTPAVAPTAAEAEAFRTEPLEGRGPRPGPSGVRARFRLTRAQWVVLGILLFLQLLVVVGFVVLVLTDLAPI
jgi:hypothetical protein